MAVMIIRAEKQDRKAREKGRSPQLFHGSVYAQSAHWWIKNHMCVCVYTPLCCLQTQNPFPAQKAATDKKSANRLNIKLKVTNIKQSFADTLEQCLDSTVLEGSDVEAARPTFHI